MKLHSSPREFRLISVLFDPVSTKKNYWSGLKNNCKKTIFFHLKVWKNVQPWAWTRGSLCFDWDYRQFSRKGFLKKISIINFLDPPKILLIKSCGGHFSWSRLWDLGCFGLLWAALGCFGLLWAALDHNFLVILNTTYLL